MPPRSRPRTQAVADLADRLASIPPGRLGPCVGRAEALIETVDAEALYAEDDLLARITGERVTIDDPGTIVGIALVSDLSALVERLSEAADQTPDDLGDGALDADQLAERWGVSVKTLARYRRLGLIARRVRVGKRRAVMFTPRAVGWFERAHADRLARAAKFSRIDSAEDERLLRRARRYRTRFGWSLNRVANRLSERTGRSVEGVRQALRRHDERSSDPVFPRAGPPSARDRRVIARALRRGIEPADIAERTGRSVASVRRAATQHRAAFLRSLDLSGAVLATFEREDAREVILAPSAVREGLVEAGIDDLAAFLADARTRRASDPALESARATAYHFLRFEAARAVASLDATTAEPGVVDRAETDLRWASNLKAALLRPHLTLIVQTLEGAVGAPLEELPSREGARLLREAIGGGSRAVDRYDPAHAGRVAAPIGLAVTRLAGAAAQSRAHRAGRASRRLGAGVPFRDWTLSLDPWQRHLAPDPRVVRAAPGLEAHLRDTIARRFGAAIGGYSGPPMTLAETAGHLGTSVVHAARFEREGVRGAIALARAQTR